MHILPAMVASLVLAAHFFRWNNAPGCLAVVATTATALIARRAWSLKILQGVLFTSPALWAFMAYRTAVDRMVEGRPFGRAVAIFAAVAAFSVWSAWLLFKPKAQERFGRA